MQIAKAVEVVNAEQKVILMPQILHDLGADLTGRRFAMWGLAFKPQTDDIREAPALYMIEELTKRGAEVVAYDPEASINVQQQIGDSIQYADSKESDIDWSRRADFDDRMATFSLSELVRDSRYLERTLCL